MKTLKKLLVSTPALLLYICVAVYAAQVAIVDTDTLNEAWTKETANNSDLQTNIDGKEDTLTNSAGLLAALDDETGTGLAVFNTSPTLVTPELGAATATSIDVDPSATPSESWKDSDSLDVDKMISRIYANATTVTAGAVVSNVTHTYKDGGDASGSDTVYMLMNGSANQLEIQVNTTLQADDVIASEIADWYAYETIPIAWMNGGTSEPDALDNSTRTPYAYRTFAADADEDLNFVWFVPSDLSGTTIQYRVKYLVTNATGPSAEGVAFGLSGVSLGDNDATNGAKGTVVVITDPTITAVQHDILITGWSGDVTITNLAAGEVAEVALIRDISDAADDYAQVVGIFAIEIRYVRNVTR